MIKKALIGVAVVAVAAWGWFTFRSYIETAADEAAECAKGWVPIEFQIKRAKKMVDDLDKKSDDLITTMAKEMTELEILKRDIAASEEWLEKEQKNIKALNEGLKSSRVALLDDRGSAAATAKLEQRFKTYQVRESTLKMQKDSLEQRKQTLAALQDELDGYKASKADLLARIDKLETELRVVKAAEARSKNKCKLDNSELAKVKTLVDDLEKQVQTRKNEVELRSQQPTPVNGSTSYRSPTELTREIDEHFGAPAKDGAVSRN